MNSHPRHSRCTHFRERINRAPLIGSLALIGLLSAGATPPSSALDHPSFIAWGIETQQQIDASLGLSGSPLYAETAHQDGSQSGGSGGVAFAWPLSTEFRVLNSLVRLDRKAYADRLRTFSDRLHQDFWSPDGGYECGTDGGDRFYDDNAHLAVALVEAYEVTGELIYLDRAIAVFRFLRTGEAPGHAAGSYWSVADHSFLDTATALQASKAASMLYKATGEAAYLSMAVDRFQWARRNTQLPRGTFLEKVYLSGPNAGQTGDYDLVNFAGFGIGAAIYLYDATDDLGYLNEAQRIASHALNRYIDPKTGRINDEGYWAFELTDALIDLHQRDRDARWHHAVVKALTWLRDNKRDPQGRYGVYWGRGGPQVGQLDEWNLNEQASVARAYLHAGLCKPIDPIEKDSVTNAPAVPVRRRLPARHP